ncbi:uncharacterized protein LOC128483709 [Spea bombifrons]|uniref:uncharacterized protein LOC128483709 n=1 Tax=Spea bombifrons TaxID=233779 RepID=UPI002349CF30|nr:uncharacterized protein LOC128483709 [Spea bombifrons]XP_053315959.1 uncharacterized protein LOC128483709 [Spea bombifrons]
MEMIHPKGSAQSPKSKPASSSQVTSAKPTSPAKTSVTSTRKNISPRPANKYTVPTEATQPESAIGSTKLKSRHTSASYPGSASVRQAAASKQQPSQSLGSRNVPARPSSAESSFAPFAEGHLSLEEVKKIEEKTRGQRNNEDWFRWRQNRITASMAHQISHSRFANDRSEEIPQSYLKTIVGTAPRVQTTAMNWGNTNEKNAVHSYERLMSRSTGREVEVEDCGLFIHPNKNWLAASPDGIVRDKKTGEKLCILEVKCPYKHRQHTIREACADPNFCLKQDGDSYILKPNHPYYTQVQCQLAVTGMERADFVVYTTKDTAAVSVSPDHSFWEEAESKLKKFYREAVIPYQNGGSKDDKGVSEGRVWAVEE